MMTPEYFKGYYAVLGTTPNPLKEYLKDNCIFLQKYLLASLSLADPVLYLSSKNFMNWVTKMVSGDINLGCALLSWEMGRFFTLISKL